MIKGTFLPPYVLAVYLVQEKFSHKNMHVDQLLLAILISIQNVSNRNGVSLMPNRLNYKTCQYYLIFSQKNSKNQKF